MKTSSTKEYCSDFERVNKFICVILRSLIVLAVIILTFSFSHDERPILKYCHCLLKIYPLLLVLISATKYQNKYVPRLSFTYFFVRITNMLEDRYKPRFNLMEFSNWIFQS